MRLGCMPVAGRDNDRREPPKRRQMAAPPRLDLGGIEGFAIARDQRLHHRMVGRVGLDQSATSLPYPPGPAGHLRQKLPGSFRRARIAMRKPKIGVDDADQRQPGEIMAFRHQLRADDDVHLATRDRTQFLTDALRATEHVARHHQRPRGWKALEHFLLQPLDARPNGDKAFLRTAAWAGRGPPLLVPAMVTDEDFSKPVLDQPGRAVRAGHAVATGATERQGRVAATIQEEQRLLTQPNRLGDCCDKRWRQPTSALRRVALLVDRDDFGSQSDAVARR